MRYHSFILTLWQEGAALPNAPPRWRYSLEHPQTGERFGFKSNADLLAFIGQWTAEPPVQPPPLDDIHEPDTPDHV